MLTQEDYWMIQEQREKGVYLKDIAEGLGVHPKTVCRALRRGSAPSRRRRREKYSKLKPFVWKVDALLSENVWNATVIYREIQALGYRGKGTVLRDYIQPKRALRSSKATVRFETRPGEQLQHDWGELETTIAGERTRVYMAVNALGYSRRFHVYAAPCCDAEHTYESLARAFNHFGGVTKHVWVDNQKAAVLTHRPGAVHFNERFNALAKHYGFVPKACRPYRARTKGKVERMVGYVKQHFFVRYRAFESFAHLNEQLEQWLAQEADQRLHGTVNEVVSVRFAREQPDLQSLPTHAFDTSYIETRQVAWDGYIEVRGNRYSVPTAYCGQWVTIRITLAERLRVLSGESCIAEHRLRSREHGWVTVADHHQRLWAEVAVQTRDLAHYEEAVRYT